MFKFNFLRNFKFTLIQQKRIRALIWLFVKGLFEKNCLTLPIEKPVVTFSRIVLHLFDFGFLVSKEFVRKIFKEWKWSWKIPTYKQIAKFSKKNLETYRLFIDWINLQDLSRVKFLDECHFVSKGF